MTNILPIINPIFLILSIILLFLTIIKKNNMNDKENQQYNINKKNYNTILIIILIIGIIIRIWKFGLVPGGFNQDGAMAAVDGYALAKYGTDRFGTWLPAHLYAWGYGQMSSLLSYLIALFIKLFGFNVVVSRLPQLLVSIMGGIFFYLFIKDILGKKIGLIAAIVVAINPWHFMQSRWTLDCNLLPHFFMAGLYFFNKGLSTKKRYIYISMIFFGLCMYCYGITIYTIPVFLLTIAIYYYIKKKISIKDILISIIIYLAISWPFILTMMVNFFKWDTIKLPFVTISYFPDSIRSNDILFFSDNIGKQLISNLISLLGTTIYQRKDLPWNDVTNFGSMYLFTMPFVYIGLIRLKKLDSNGNNFLIVSALLTGIWVGLTTNNVNINRINIIYYGIMMFATIGIYYVTTNIKNSKWIISTMYLIISLFFLNTYFNSYANEISHAFYDGFGDAVIAAEKTDANYIYITADIQSTGNAAVSEILTLFYNKTDPKYFQGKTNINNGKELLPYQERYTFKSITSETVENSKDKNTAYIIMNSDKQYFDNKEYKITDYGSYSLVIKDNQ